MSQTMLGNRLVRDYLRDLKAACAALPAGQARELREQIAAHLEDALPPGASDADVAAELRKLGTPRSLAAEAAQAAQAAGTATPSPAARLRTRLSRLRWWTWTVIAATVAVIATMATYLYLVTNAQPLQQGYFWSWWSAQDRAQSVETSAAGVSQLTVPERVGQQQGFVVGIVNDSDWTQTILGPTDDWQYLGSSPVSFAVGSGHYADMGSWYGHTTWSLPGSIPPHAIRLLRVLWTSDLCEVPGGATIITNVTLRVRVGLVTRTENLQLGIAFGLAGTKATVCTGNRVEPQS